jgi:hypothetical protein
MRRFRSLLLLIGLAVVAAGASGCIVVPGRWHHGGRWHHRY